MCWVETIEKISATPKAHRAFHLFNFGTSQPHLTYPVAAAHILVTRHMEFSGRAWQHHDLGCEAVRATVDLLCGNRELGGTLQLLFKTGSEWRGAVGDDGGYF